MVNKAQEASLHQIQGPIAKTTITNVSLPFTQDDIHQLLITPQEGEWILDEVSLTQSVFPYTERKAITFRDYYKTKSPHLEPLVPFITLSPEFKKEADEEYQAFKDHIIITAFKTTAIGTLATFCVANEEKALAFAAGGFLGIFYATLLQESVDKLRASATNTAQLTVLKATLRQLLIFSIAAAMLTQYKANITEDNSIFFFAIIGFFLTRLGYF